MPTCVELFAVHWRHNQSVKSRGFLNRPPKMIDNLHQIEPFQWDTGGTLEDK